MKSKFALKLQSSIAAAIIPKTLFAAVPRTPPPTLDPETRDSYDLELTTGTGVLTASLLGRMFTTPPPDDCLTEETDTSLYDYEQARGTMSYVINNDCVFKSVCVISVYVVPHLYSMLTLQHHSHILEKMLLRIKDVSEVLFSMQ